jgi:acetyltransferase
MPRFTTTPRDRANRRGSRVDSGSASQHHAFDTKELAPIPQGRPAWEGLRVFKSPVTVLRARSLAIVGASERAKWPGDIYASLKNGGYAGNIYPINPRYSEVWGGPCYSGFGALPEPVEHAVVIVPASHVIPVIEDAVKNGVKSATVYSAGVGDGADPESHARGRRLREICKESGLVVGGPNCMGGLSWHEKLFLYPNRSIGNLPAGSVAFVSQSGGMVQFWVQSAGDRGVKFSFAVSTGNEIDLDLADYLDFMVEDDKTRVIVLFIEGIRRPEAFMDAAARALAKGKPIVAIKSGRTEKSRAAALSHTGAIAGDFAGYEAMCERYGIVNCRNLDDMVEMALAFQAGRLAKGNRIGFVTTSGGTVDLLWDYAESEKAVFPPFAKATVKALEPLMQEGIKPKNPLDAGIPAGLEHAGKMCEAALRDPNIDMVAWAGQLPGKKGGWDDVAPVRRLLDVTEKPLIGFGRMYYQLSPQALDAQDAIGIPFLQGLEPTVRALNALAFYGARAGKVLPPIPAPKKNALTPETLEDTLARYGISVPRSAVAKSAADAARAARRIGFPVALKIVSGAISHKTEAGGVLLGLNSPAEVTAAARTLAARARKHKRGARIDGFLVQEMVDGVEAILGARNDPLYGPLLVVGSGGVLVELARDAALRLLPLAAGDVRAMIADLKLKTLLKGFRGKPPADEAALVKAAVGLSRFFLDHRDRLADIEINPIIVRPKGKGAVAVDVRAVWRAPRGGR